MDYDKTYSDQSYQQMVGTNGKVDAFRKTVHALLKSAGWVREVGIQSALYHWEWKRGNQCISMYGWHGTGKKGTCRYWGSSKSFFNLYHIDGIDHLKHIESPISDPHLANLLVVQDQKMAEVIRYIQSIT